MVNFIQKYKANPLLLNYSKVFGVDFLVRASNFLLLPVYLKLMTQVEFGLYTYIFGIISTFSLVLNFGLYIPQSKLYQETEDVNYRGKLIYTINMLLISLLIIVFSIIYFFGFDLQIVAFLFKSPINYHDYRLFIFIALVMTIYSFMLTNYFLTSQKITSLQFYNLLRMILVNSLVILLLYMSTGDKVGIRLKFTYLSEFFLLLIFGLFYIKAMVTDFDFTIAKRAVKLAFPIMVSAILGVILNFSDRFFLEKYGDFNKLAIYNLGITMASIIPIIFTSFQGIWLPFFFKEKDIYKNKEKTKSVIMKMTIFFIIISLCIYIGVYLCFRFEIISVEYIKVLDFLPIILMTQICLSITPLFSNYIVYFEKTYITLYTGVPLAVISVLLNVLLIPQYGIYGAAFVSLTVNAGYLFLYYLISKNLIRKSLN